MEAAGYSFQAVVGACHPELSALMGEQSNGVGNMADYFDVDPAATAPCICECCGWDVESEQGCQCPECHECGEQGNPNCYRDPCCGGHNMEYNEIQRYGLAKRREMDEQERKQDEAAYRDWVQTQAFRGGGL